MASVPAAPDLRDPMQVAVQMTELRGLFGQVQQQLVNVTQNLNSTMQSFQATQEQLRGDIRIVADHLKSIDSSQHEQNARSSGIERAHKEIEDFVREAREERQKDREDEAKFRNDLRGELEQLRIKSSRVSNFALGVSCSVGMMLGLVTYIYISDKTNNQHDFDTVKQTMNTHVTDADLRQDRIEAVLIQMCAEQKRDCRFR
jgi:polyhydroxyalkanoate synthesis regulator protein